MYIFVNLENNFYILLYIDKSDKISNRKWFMGAMEGLNYSQRWVEFYKPYSVSDEITILNHVNNEYQYIGFCETSEEFKSRFPEYIL